MGRNIVYRDPLLSENDVVVGISQSGETADTLAAMREARKKKARVLAICNVVGSTMAREADGTLYTHAGPEIGVASTKAFTAQLVALYLLALRLGRLRGVLDREKGLEYLENIRHLPSLVEQVLKQGPEIEDLAKKYAQARDFLYLGRGLNYPIALEGALKTEGNFVYSCRRLSGGRNETRTNLH